MLSDSGPRTRSSVDLRGLAGPPLSSPRSPDAISVRLGGRTGSFVGTTDDVLDDFVAQVRRERDDAEAEKDDDVPRIVGRKLSKMDMKSANTVREYMNDPTLASVDGLEPGDVLEMLVDPSPDELDNSVGLGRYRNVLLGSSGGTQPQILFSSKPYLLDYLVVPHHGKTTLNLHETSQKTSRKEAYASSPTTRARTIHDRTLRTTDVPSLIDTVVPDWVVQVWKSFFLSFTDFFSVEEFVDDLLHMHDAAGVRRPGASADPGVRAGDQVAFETSDNFVAVVKAVTSRTVPEDESDSTSRSTKSSLAVLAWMGLSHDSKLSNRSNNNSKRSDVDGSLGGAEDDSEKSISAPKLKLNVLILLMYYLSRSSGSVALTTRKDLVEKLRAFVKRVRKSSSSTRGAFTDPDAVDALTERALSTLDNLLSTIKRHNTFPNRMAVRQGVDLDGALMREHMSKDELHIYEMSLCFVQRSLPTWFVKSVGLKQFSPAQVANQLTLLLYDTSFRHIRSEMMHTAEARRTALHTKNMVRYFRILSWWPLGTILKPGIPLKERLELVLFFIEVCEELRRLNNYHALFGVMGGLTQPLLAWLFTSHSERWTAKTKRRVDNLKRVVSPLNDYRVYKADLSKCQKNSRIPFMGLSNKILDALEESAAVYDADRDALVNFGRCLARQAVIDEFLGGQRAPYETDDGTVYVAYAGPPGPSPYPLAEEGRVVTLNNDYTLPSFVAPRKPSETTPAAIAAGRKARGTIVLQNDSDLHLLLSYVMSQTMTPDALELLSLDAKKDAIANPISGTFSL